MDRDPSPGTHLAMRSGLSHKGRGEAARAVRIVAPSPLVGEGCSDGGHKLSWVRGLPPRVELIEGSALVERDPSPGTHLAMRSGLSHKGRGEADRAGRVAVPSPVVGVGNAEGGARCDELTRGDSPVEAGQETAP